MLTDYVFRELLDLLDLSWRAHDVVGGCPVVHLLPRFIHTPNDSTQPASLLPISAILYHWMFQAQLPLIEASDIPAIQRMPNSEWSAHIDELRGTLAWKPGVVGVFFIITISLQARFLVYLPFALCLYPVETTSHSYRPAGPGTRLQWQDPSPSLPLPRSHDLHSDEAESFP